ncbi:SOS response-associated peptidase family protein [Paraburkholderia megapolitana]|uniref:SOS response-associated peptidase family protein n=1 Tax=Paraburkholderia megapolitana TaxID=420953 RepID=UPI0038BA76BF
MCTNYRAPDEDPRISELKIDIGKLWRHAPWKVDVYPDYNAPIMTADPVGQDGVVAVFGFWPKFLQPERLSPAGKKLAPYNTVNARGEEVGTKRLYAKAWREGRRCLIPARWVVEPCWESGKNVWHHIGIANVETYCVAGVWSRYEDPDRGTLVGMTMLTLNADDHALMKRMHRPNDEKRSVVVIRPEDYDEWLHTTNVDAARSMLQLWPAEEMWTEPVPG